MFWYLLLVREQIVNSNAPITAPNINSIYQYSNLIPGTTTINMPGSTINNVPIILPTQQPQYITGVITLPVKLSKQQIEKSELQNIIWESQEIEQEVSNNQAFGGPVYSNIAIDPNISPNPTTLAKALADVPTICACCAKFKKNCAGCFNPISANV